MGWCVFHHYSRKDIIDHLRRNLVSGGSKLLRSSVVDNHLWALLRHPSGELWLANILIQGGTRRDPGWGYKDLSHRDSDTCPVSYLSHLPATTDPAELAWRESVRKHHRKNVVLAHTKRALAAGDEVEYGGRVYRLDQNLQRRGWTVTCLNDGKHYRMKATQLSSAVKRTLA